MKKVLGSEVQARPGATACGHEIVFAFYGLGFPSPHIDMPGLGQGFKSYNILIFIALCSTVRIGLFHPLGETRNSTRLTRYTNE